MFNQTLSDELTLIRHQNGVKLIVPDSSEITFKNPSIGSLGYLTKLPYSVYIMAKNDSAFLHANEVNASLLHADSIQDLIGRTVTEFADSISAQQVLDNDRNVLTTKNMLIIEEEADLASGEDNHVHCLTFKMPCYQNDDELLGVFGISVPVLKSQLGQAINDIARLGLLPQARQSNQISSTTSTTHRFDHTLLTKREHEVLNLLAKGFSAKCIADKLFLSVRTVEHHIENIKHKACVKTKYQLLEVYNA